MTARVEFCGVPASGKSTLCAGALRLLRRRGHDFLDREALVAAGLRARDFGVLGNVLGVLAPGWRREVLGLPHGLNDWQQFVVDHPAFAAQVHRWFAESEADATWRSTVLYSFFASAFEFQIAREVKTPVLMDEGFAQRFFTLRGYRGLGRVGDAALYAARMPVPSGLVWVTTPPEVCVDRARKRAQIPRLLRHEPAALLSVRLAEGTALLSELAAELERRGVPLLRVPGVGEPEAAFREIAAFAEPICARATTEERERAG